MVTARGALSTCVRQRRGTEVVQRITTAVSAAALLAISGSSPRTNGPPTPVLELDHVYIVVPPGADAAVQALRHVGLVIDSSVNRHVGQGTASMAVFFENVYLELLWVDSSVTVDSAHRLGLADFVRAQTWRQSGASPFGVGLHFLSGTPSDLGIPIRLDSAERMRPGTAYLLLRQLEESSAVDVFITPDYLAVTSWMGRFMIRRPDLFGHPMGVRRVTRALVRGQPHQLPRAAQLQPRLVGFEKASSPLLVLEFDGGHRGQTLDLRPVLPLILRH
jgi:hypothetical protein